MQSLAVAKSNVQKGMPYTKPLRLKVVAASSEHEYKPDRKMKDMGLADATSTVRAACFDEEKFRRFSPGSGVILTNFTWKNGEIQINSSTKVHVTSATDVPQDIEDDARCIIHPKEPPVIPIAEA